MLHKALFNCDWGANPSQHNPPVPELSMLMPDLSLHRSNSHSVDTSCQRIRTEQKHVLLFLQERKGEEEIKQR